jgi:hypothetical protein
VIFRTINPTTMKKMLLCVSALLITFTLHLSAQSTVNKNLPAAQFTQPNFYSIQQAFYNAHRDKDKLDGEENEEDSYYNQFKRWEYLMESRVFPSRQLAQPFNRVFRV